MSGVVGDLVCVILWYVVCVLVSCALYYLKVECRDEIRVIFYVIWITRDYLRSWWFCVCHTIICSVCLNVMCIVLSESEVSRWITCDVWRSWNMGCVIVWCALCCLKVFMCDVWRCWWFSVCHTVICSVFLNVMCIVLSQSRELRWITCDVLRNRWFSVCHTGICSVCLSVMCIVLSGSEVSRLDYVWCLVFGM